MDQTGSFSFMQQSATANGNGLPAQVSGYTGAQQIEVAETAGGTCTLTLQGSFDGLNWYSVGYQQVDGVASLVRSVSAVSVTANSRHVYQILDPYPQVRAVISAIAGGANVSARMYAVPA